MEDKDLTKRSPELEKLYQELAYYEKSVKKHNLDDIHAIIELLVIILFFSPVQCAVLFYIGYLEIVYGPKWYLLIGAITSFILGTSSLMQVFDDKDDGKTPYKDKIKDTFNDLKWSRVIRKRYREIKKEIKKLEKECIFLEEKPIEQKDIPQNMDYEQISNCKELINKINTIKSVMNQEKVENILNQYADNNLDLNEYNEFEQGTEYKSMQRIRK